MSYAPDRIWTDLDANWKRCSICADGREVTAADHVFTDAIEYVRVYLYEALEAKNKRLLQRVAELEGEQSPEKDRAYLEAQIAEVNKLLVEAKIIGDALGERQYLIRLNDLKVELDNTPGFNGDSA